MDVQGINYGLAIADQGTHQPRNPTPNGSSSGPSDSARTIGGGRCSRPDCARLAGLTDREEPNVEAARDEGAEDPTVKDEKGDKESPRGSDART